MSNSKCSENKNAEYAKLYQEAHHEELLEYWRNYYWSHRDSVLAKRKRRYQENKEKALEYQRDYYARNRDRITAEKRDLTNKQANRRKKLKEADYDRS